MNHSRLLEPFRIPFSAAFPTSKTLNRSGAKNSSPEFNGLRTNPFPKRGVCIAGAIKVLLPRIRFVLICDSPICEIARFITKLCSCKSVSPTKLLKRKTETRKRFDQSVLACGDDFWIKTWTKTVLIQYNRIELFDLTQPADVNDTESCPNDESF